MSLSLEGLRWALRRLGLSPSEVALRRLFDELQLRGARGIGIDEFCALVMPSNSHNFNPNVYYALCKFDRDGDGRMNVGDLTKALGIDKGAVLNAGQGNTTLDNLRVVLHRYGLSPNDASLRCLLTKFQLNGVVGMDEFYPLVMPSNSRSITRASLILFVRWTGMETAA
ncbi:hypothetical protein HGRIS_011376 [Hohenbuehelia grisea]|uniref:EF-hand domain-containing protein n=1 Tax=Hohenbuehelia grisea TaxID=104357 RepID=A0ABR3JVU7_9AGAR